MKFFSIAKDGGPKSHVTGYWLIEVKWLFTVVLLRFAQGTREAYHSHAFNALSWFLSGEVEERLFGSPVVRTWKPSFRPKWTPRSCFHKVYAKRTTWCLSIRGPWQWTWREYIPATGEMHTLTHGRKVMSSAVVVLNNEEVV